MFVVDLENKTALNGTHIRAVQGITNKPEIKLGSDPCAGSNKDGKLLDGEQVDRIDKECAKNGEQSRQLNMPLCAQGTLLNELKPLPVAGVLSAGSSTSTTLQPPTNGHGHHNNNNNTYFKGNTSLNSASSASSVDRRQTPLNSSPSSSSATTQLPLKIPQIPQPQQVVSDNLGTSSVSVSSVPVQHLLQISGNNQKSQSVFNVGNPGTSIFTRDPQIAQPYPLSVPSSLPFRTPIDPAAINDWFYQQNMNSLGIRNEITNNGMNHNAAFSQPLPSMALDGVNTMSMQSMGMNISGPYARSALESLSSKILQPDMMAAASIGVGGGNPLGAMDTGVLLPASLQRRAY